MKTVILCGGRGTRIAEETQTRPKPLVEIGGRPILWHIMNSYASGGFSDFVLALGYKGEMVKDYFLNFRAHRSDLVVDLLAGEVAHSSTVEEDWTVTLVDTGDETLTGGRLLRLRPLLEPDGPFMLTYGDGVSDLDINELVEFHRSHGRLATVTAVRPPARFGAIQLEGDQVRSFEEKPQTGEGWINGGFFVFEPGVFDYLVDDRTVLEESPLEELADSGQLMAFRHPGFWHSMDTLRDKESLEALWSGGRPPWVS